MYSGTGTVTTMYSVRWERANAEVGSLTLAPGETCAGTGPSHPGCSKGTEGAAQSCSFAFESFSPTPLHCAAAVAAFVDRGQDGDGADVALLP